jgi:SAM-dependent methyltransferase
MTISVRKAATLRALRRVTFWKGIELDEQLVDFCSGEQSHYFLSNPTGHAQYVYLAKYVIAASGVLLGEKRFPLSVLDWGCGKGQMSLLLSKAGQRVTPCDVADSTPESSFNQNTPIIQRAGLRVDPLPDAVRLPYEDCTFDVVLSVGVLEHLPRERESLSEVSRVLRPGGLSFDFFLPQLLSHRQALMRPAGNQYHDRLCTPKKASPLVPAHSG